jgi:uncharacterized membrane protein
MLALIAALAALGLALAPTMAAESAPTLEQLGDVQVVTPAVGEGKPHGVADLVGRLHPALVHFPIAGLVALTLVDFVGLVLRREAWRGAGLIVLVATAVSLLPTAATGLLRAATMTIDAAEQPLLVTHRTLNLTVAGLVVAALVLGLVRRQRLQGASRIVYLALVLVATGLVLVAADFGGRLVYGSDYLPF